MADPRTTQVAADPAHEQPAWRCRVGDEQWAPGLSVWPVAQRSPAAQRRGRYVAGSAAHPARMLPDLAAHAIHTYTRPGELVADPLAGVGTTLVEAVHGGRHAIGVEHEPGWAALAAANITHAHAQGGTGHAEVIQADATGLPDILPNRYWGQVALVLTSPPYGRTMHGRVEHRRGPLTRFHNSYGHPDPANLAHRNRIGLLAGLTRVLAGCRPLLRPDGLIVVTARPWRRNGLLVDLPGQIIDAATAAGLHPVDRCVALLAAVRDNGHLQPRHSFWQLTVTRQARRNGSPLSLLVHEDALVFAVMPTRTRAGGNGCPRKLGDRLASRAEGHAGVVMSRPRSAGRKLDAAAPPDRTAVTGRATNRDDLSPRGGESRYVRPPRASRVDLEPPLVRPAAETGAA